MQRSRRRAAPPAPSPSSTGPKEHVKPEHAEDPSDQKFYNMAADHQNRMIDREAPSDPSASNGDRLARRYAPVLVLPDGAYDLPADPEAFIENSRWREDRSFRGDKEHGNNINGDADDDFSAAEIGQSDGGREFLDLADNRRDIGDENAPFFYQVDDPDKPSKITYWFFYPYNDGPGPQNHEGDFERITLELDPATGRPTEAIYSAHGNKHTVPVPFDQLQFYQDPATGEATDKPLVYVASGSHASYPTPGSHQSDAPDAPWLGVPFGVGGIVVGDQINNGALNDRTVGSIDEAAHVIIPARTSPMSSGRTGIPRAARGCAGASPAMPMMRRAGWAAGPPAGLVVHRRKKTTSSWTERPTPYVPASA
ncbi:MAG: hypothetical protein OEU92_18545 [Alphaproteobacteria bacterium]|nr:hypothetical protein [Alphaproteobacteria bacterium]